MQDGTEKSQKVFISMPCSVGQTEAEEIGGCTGIWFEGGMFTLQRYFICFHKGHRNCVCVSSGAVTTVLDHCKFVSGQWVWWVGRSSVSWYCVARTYMVVQIHTYTHVLCVVRHTISLQTASIEESSKLALLEWSSNINCTNHARSPETLSEQFQLSSPEHCGCFLCVFVWGVAARF